MKGNYLRFENWACVHEYMCVSSLPCMHVYQRKFSIACVIIMVCKLMHVLVCKLIHVLACSPPLRTGRSTSPIPMHNFGMMHPHHHQVCMCVCFPCISHPMHVALVCVCECTYACTHSMRACFCCFCGSSLDVCTHSLRASRSTRFVTGNHRMCVSMCVCVCVYIYIYIYIYMLVSCSIRSLSQVIAAGGMHFGIPEDGKWPRKCMHA
jgi:hypothetical protein